MLTKKELQAMASALTFWSRCLPPMGKDLHREKGIRDSHDAIRLGRAALKRLRGNGAANAVKDTERLEFLMRNMSATEQRRLGIMTAFPSGCTRESIDLARAAFEQEPLPRALRVVVTVDGDDDLAVAQALRNSAVTVEKTGGANGSGVGGDFEYTVDRTENQKGSKS